MSIRLWPQDFERKEHITKYEKALLRFAERNFNDGHMVVNINMLGMGNNYGFYISPTEGLVTFSIIDGDINTSIIEAYKQGVKLIESKVYERLLDSKALITKKENYKILKFPYKHILMFPDDKLKTSAKDREELAPLEGYATLGLFKPVNLKKNISMISDLEIFKGIRVNYSESFNHLTELEEKAIFERLAPEYTVLLNEEEIVTVPTEKSNKQKYDYTITGQEQEYKTFFLDELQVGLVNDLGTGHRVVLANPGAGKSVILLSKAFKYAGMFPNSNILLTCYNNNLADSYNFKKNCADFGTNNKLFIATLHKLVEKLYEDQLKTHLNGAFATDDEIRNLITFIKQGKVKIKFKAIFIDEVQIFDPLYLELCYLLLDKEDPEHTFLMAGDLNQKVRASSKRGDAPWKRIDGIKLDFTGRVKYIDKNYRNSKEVAEYIQKMLEHMNARFEMLDMNSDLEYEYNKFTPGNKKAIALKVLTGIDRNVIQKAVINSILEINEKYGVSYSDIAVLFPYKTQFKDNYFFENWIVKVLKANGINYSFITKPKTKGINKGKFARTSGVILSTIDSSLGLDFKAVIVAGLHPYQFVYYPNGKTNSDGTSKISQKKIKSWTDIQKMTEEQQNLVQKQMRAVYTACSRARDLLYVISDIDAGTPMDEIINRR